MKQIMINDERLETLNPADIKSDSYQRPINPAKVAYYKEDVDGTPRYLLSNANTPLISFRDNQYWCVDGQHRIQAMAEAGVTSFQFLVKHGLSFADEKKLFLAHWMQKTGGTIPT